MSLLTGTRRTLLGGAAAFSPLDIDGLQLWLKADAGLWQDSVGGTPAVVDSDVVGAWADQSGNSNHATQATTSQKPLLKTGIVNGRDVVRFDGTDDYFPLTISGFQSWTQMTMIYVIRPHIAGAPDAGHNGILGFGDGSPFLLIGNNTGFMSGETWAISILAGNERLGVSEANFDWAANEVFIESFVTGAGTQLYKNSSQITLDMTNGGGSASKDYAPADTAIDTDVIFVGAWNNEGTPFGYVDMDIAEILLWNSTLSAANLSALWAYLNTRFAVY